MDTTPQSRRPAFARWLGATNEVTRRFPGAGRIPDLINIAGGLPAPELYPAAELTEIARHRAASAGDARLHADRRVARSVRCSGRALQHAGAEAGARECARHHERAARPRPHRHGAGGGGGLVAAQFPTYLGALDAWRPRQPRYRHLDLEDPGLDPVAAMQGVQFAYAVPNFSNSTACGRSRWKQGSAFRPAACSMRPVRTGARCASTSRSIRPIGWPKESGASPSALKTMTNQSRN